MDSDPCRNPNTFVLVVCPTRWMCACMCICRRRRGFIDRQRMKAGCSHNVRGTCCGVALPLGSWGERDGGRGRQGAFTLRDRNQWLGNCGKTLITRRAACTSTLSQISPHHRCFAPTLGQRTVRIPSKYCRSSVIAGTWSFPVRLAVAFPVVWPTIAVGTGTRRVR